ncbi:hypothetical protein [Chondromyces crocatus]|uniref:Secreted protein n=1 Tax=Chondromyces crocatus TaxID=52 RepID=A0A0K1EI39_CHOCO|nr:hypothetical protein [Chondromyces crocatus]AKT40524.1 uncharacterized protein CMC5_046790 [Chondromyces crocatus]
MHVTSSIRTVLASSALVLLLGQPACAPENTSTIEVTPLPSGLPDARKGEVLVDAQGALHFASPQAFFDQIDALNAMTAAEMDAWEDGIGFVSERRRFEEVMAEVAAAETEAEADAILSAHQDLIEVIGDEARPRIQAGGYRSVVGPDGVFHVNGVVHKVLPSRVISAEDGRIETIEAALAAPEAAAAGAFAGVNVVSYARGVEDDSSAVALGCTDRREAFASTSDRKVEFTLSTSREYCAGCCGTYYHRVRVDLQLEGYKKNWLGKWVSYDTAYEHQNVAFKLDAPRVTGFNGVSSSFYYDSYSVSIPAGSSNCDAKTWGISMIVGDQVQNASIDEPYFTRVKGQGKSRGTGAGTWANICCGYAEGCGF